MKICICVMLLASTLVWAQNPPPTKAAPADNYSGMYSFLQDGEFIQISVDDGNRVTGFISCFGDADKTVFVDYFFDKAELHDHDLRFSTRKVQGKWFEFQGTISRGEGKTRGDEAYYLIKGKLTEHAGDGKPAAKESQVTLRSFPQDVEDEGNVRHPVGERFSQHRTTGTALVNSLTANRSTDRASEGAGTIVHRGADV